MSPFNNSSPSSSSFLHLLLLLPLCISVVFSSSSETPTKIGQGYRLISLEESPDGGILGLLQIKQKNNIYGLDIPLLQLYVKHETENRLRVHITDAKTQRWEVPYDLLPRDEPPGLQQNINRSKKTQNNGGIITKLSEYSGNELIFSLTSDPFNFIIKRKSNNQTLFNSTPDKSDTFNELVFKDLYLEISTKLLFKNKISTKLPKDASIYGLGENTQPHGIKLFPNDPYTLYTTDASAINLNTDLYGSHPMYMDLRNVNGQASTHAVLLLNSNGMDVFYRGDSLTYKVIGGVLDFYFFSGPSPLDVVDQYTTLVGRPAPMPYWSFEFNLDRLLDISLNSTGFLFKLIGIQRDNLYIIKLLNLSDIRRLYASSNPTSKNVKMKKFDVATQEETYISSENFKTQESYAKRNVNVATTSTTQTPKEKIKSYQASSSKKTAAKENKMKTPSTQFGFLKLVLYCIVLI